MMQTTNNVRKPMGPIEKTFGIVISTMFSSAFACMAGYFFLFWINDLNLNHLFLILPPLVCYSTFCLFYRALQKSGQQADVNYQIRNKVLPSIADFKDPASCTTYGGRNYFDPWKDD